MSIFYFFGVFLISALEATSEIDFTPNRITLIPSKKEYMLFVEQSHMITCEGDADDNLKWLKPDGFEVDFSKGRLHVEKVGGQLRLIIEKIRKEDQGEWSCVSEFEEGDDGAVFVMNVYEKIRFENVKREIKVREGENITIPCEVMGLPEPTVQWYFNERALEANMSNENSKYRKLGDGLLISNVRHDDSGEYTCRALQITTVMTNSDERIIRLNVQYKPVMFGHPHKVKYGFVDGEVNLVCDAEARPKPDFTWYRHGKKIFRNIESEESHSILRLIIKSKDDFGEYKCKAKNELGYRNQTITLIEGKKPEMPQVFFIRGFSSDTFDIDVGAKVDPKTHHLMSINGYRFELIPKDVFKTQKSWTGSIIKDFSIADGVTYLLSQLSEDTTYMVRVAARNAAGISDWTETQEFKTLSKQPPHHVTSASSRFYSSFIIAKAFACILFVYSQTVEF